MRNDFTSKCEPDDALNTEELLPEFSEHLLFDTLEEERRGETKYFILVIYDISDNKRRNKLVKLLKGFGVRVQKSAFEAVLSARKYVTLLEKIAPVPDADDSVRVYKIRGKGALTIFGNQFTLEDEEVIII